MYQTLCANCLNRDVDWFDKNGHVTEIPFCAANKPNFPVAHVCVSYEPKEAGDAE